MKSDRLVTSRTSEPQRKHVAAAVSVAQVVLLSQRMSPLFWRRILKTNVWGPDMSRLIRCSVMGYYLEWWGLDTCEGLLGPHCTRDQVCRSRIETEVIVLVLSRLPTCQCSMNTSHT